MISILVIDFSDELEELGLLDSDVDLLGELSPSLLHPTDTFSELVKFRLKLREEPKLLLLLLHRRFEHSILLEDQLVFHA